MAIYEYLFSIKIFFSSSFVVPRLIIREGCSLTTPYSTRGHIKVGTTNLSYNRSALYKLRTDHTETGHVIAVSPVQWRTDCCLATSYNIRPIVACAYRGVFIKPLPTNGLHNPVLLLRASSI
jgi:hypothetical protein